MGVGAVVYGFSLDEGFPADEVFLEGGDNASQDAHAVEAAVEGQGLRGAGNEETFIMEEAETGYVGQQAQEQGPAQVRKGHTLYTNEAPESSLLF
jgi:hypothetical protein